MTTFVGFGFGAIQAGLFLYEAFQTGAFDRLVVAEVQPARVAALRTADGMYRINVAHADRVEAVTVGPIEIYDPAQSDDRAALIEAVAEAEELATAIPSVRFYAGDGPDSLHRILAAGIEQKINAGGPQAALYAAENHNHAAELLREAVAQELSPAARADTARTVAFLNTVIGKMSGLVRLPEVSAPQALAPITPTADEAFLVEAFNRILVSQPVLAPLAGQTPYVRRIQVFAEKPDLLPFEEAKLYGHNALHAVAGYLGWIAGLATMAQLPERPAILDAARRAAVDEAGVGLRRRYAGVDPIFTPAGFAAYADDLLVRMVNPYLRDAIVRVTRDPARKLGWRDRLVGAMRLALTADRDPAALALGAAAAYACWLDEHPGLADAPPADVLTELWETDAPPAAEAAAVAQRVEQGQAELQAWRRRFC